MIPKGEVSKHKIPLTLHRGTEIMKQFEFNKRKDEYGSFLVTKDSLITVHKDSFYI